MLWVVDMRPADHVTKRGCQSGEKRFLNTRSMCIRKIDDECGRLADLSREFEASQVAAIAKMCLKQACYPQT